MATNKKQRKVVDKVLTSFGLVATLVLLVMATLAWATYSYTTSNVRTELAAQKVYFPPKGSPAIAALPLANQTQMNKYAGDQLLNGDQAKVYANDFIAFHLTEVAGGQTYAQVSEAALANPSDLTLKAQAATLFQGETLRGLLLGDAYAFWTVGMVAQIAAIVLFIAGGIMLLLTLLGLGHLAVSRK